MEKVVLLFRVGDVRVNQQRIRLTVNGLHLVLDRIEELGLGPLDFTRESHGQILHHNPIRPREESNDVLDEVALIVSELFPMCHVLTEVHFLSEPHHCTMVLVLFPQIRMLNRKENKSVLVFL